MTTYLLDVSWCQSAIAWERVRDWVGALGEHVAGAFAKAVEGAFGVDPSFAHNWSELERVGLPRGPYDFLDPFADPIAQAVHFFDTVRKAGGYRLHFDLLPMVDVETSRRAMSARDFAKHLRAYCEKVKLLFGVGHVVIYTGGPIFDSDTDGADADDLAYFRAQPLWLAAYVPRASLKRFIPHAWAGKQQAIWQESGNVTATGSKGFTIPGIPVVVDLDELEVPLSDLIAGGPLPHDTDPAPAPTPEAETDPGTPEAKRNSSQRIAALTGVPILGVDK